MPPRLAVAAIVLFWLAANGLLFYREVWPYWRPGEPPPYSIDLTEELGKAAINWDVLQNQVQGDGEAKEVKVGYAISEVARLPDTTYRLNTRYHFEKVRLLGTDIRKITGMYHVTEDGELLDLASSVKVEQRFKKLTIEHEFEVRGRVVDGKLAPKFLYNSEELKLGDITVPVTGQGGALNPMQPLNRLPGLSEGRKWRITLFDPLSSAGKALGAQFQELFAAVEGMTIPELAAEVKTDVLHWADEDVLCFKIEYRKPGEPDLVAATWVRRRDGLVLQQFSHHDMLEMTLRRNPAR